MNTYFVPDIMPVTGNKNMKNTVSNLEHLRGTVGKTFTLQCDRTITKYKKAKETSTNRKPQVTGKSEKTAEKKFYIKIKIIKEIIRKYLYFQEK